MGEYYKVNESELFLDIINKLFLKFELKNEVSLSSSSVNKKTLVFFLSSIFFSFL